MCVVLGLSYIYIGRCTTYEKFYIVYYASN